MGWCIEGNLLKKWVATAGGDHSGRGQRAVDVGHRLGVEVRSVGWAIEEGALTQAQLTPQPLGGVDLTPGWCDDPGQAESGAVIVNR